MKRLILILALTLWVLLSFGQYYDSVINLSGQNLYFGLRNLISSNTNSDYNEAKEQMFGYFDNNSGYVRCVYTGQDYSVPVGGMPNQNILNTEHTYAQSWFSSPQSSIKKADLFHLFPTNAQVNSSRGNLPFDTVVSVNNTYTHSHGYVSKRGNNAQGIQVFEPADQHKGNLARALLYFNVRYNDTLTQANVNMIPILLVWHVLDPVDNAELTRNQNIYGYQGNRNPFVDHPEFVNRIWGPVETEDELMTPQISISSIYPNPSRDNFCITYSLKNPASVNLKVYNTKGQLIAEPLSEHKASGYHQSLWGAMDTNGKKVAPGIYIIRIQSGAESHSQKVVIR